MTTPENDDSWTPQEKVSILFDEHSGFELRLANPYAADRRRILRPCTADTESMNRSTLEGALLSRLGFESTVYFHGFLKKFCKNRPS
jgi:hypothetical protein